MGDVGGGDERKDDGRQIGIVTRVKRVANAVLVGIAEAVAVAVQSGIRIGARAVVEGGGVVVVARRGIETAGARGELAGPIVIGGILAVVTSRDVGTSGDFEFVTDAIPIGVTEAVAVAVEAGLGEGAGPIVIGGVLAVVTSRDVGTSGDFEFVTDAVPIGVGEAVAVAVVAGIGVGAGPIVVGGFGVEVAGRDVCAPVHVIHPEEEGVPEFVHAVSIDEDLAVHLSAEFTRRGELADEHLQVIAGHTVGIAVERVPGAANDVVDGDAATGKSSAGIEVGRPRVDRGLDGAHIGLPSHHIGHPFQADRHPAVVGEVRIDREEQAVDAIRRGSAQHGVVVRRGGVDVRGVDGVTGDGRHEVVGVVHLDVETGAAVAREVGHTEGTDEHADVFADDFQLKSVAFRGGRRHHGAGLENQTGSGQEQAQKETMGIHRGGDKWVKCAESTH